MHEFFFNLIFFVHKLGAIVSNINPTTYELEIYKLIILITV